MTVTHQICSSFLYLESKSIFIEGTLHQSLDLMMTLCLIQKYEASYDGRGIQSNPIHSNPIQSKAIQTLYIFNQQK
jgi:hypothetical protein